MTDILIRRVIEATKDILRRHAEQKRRSLDTPPFGSWLVAISRPGVEPDEAMAAIRSSPIRPANFD